MGKVYRKSAQKIEILKLNRYEKGVMIIASIALSCSVILSTRLYCMVAVCCIASLLYLATYVFEYRTVKVYKCSYLTNSILFFCLVALSAIWAYWEISPPLANAFQIFIFFIPNYLLFSYMVRGRNDIRLLLYILEISAFIVAIYTLNFYGFTEFSNMLQEGKRIGNDFANSNTIGVFITIGVLAYIYDLLFIKINIFKMVFIIPCIYIIAYSGSRKAFLALAIGLFLLWVHRFKGKNIFYTIMKEVIAVVIIVLIGTEILSLPIFSMILERIDLIRHFDSTTIMKTDYSTYLRGLYISIGISAFFQSPILGIGIGNTNELIFQQVGRYVYTHNNYVEMLACLGIIGFVLYYMMWIRPLVYVIKKNCKSKFSNPEPFFCIVVTLILLFLDCAMVPYLDFSNYFYIMLISAEAYLIKRGSIVLGEA